MSKLDPGKGRGGAKGVRCAIYTRKSSEEGLEQDFNSLDAQREACEAYITSQKHEGWTIVKAPYDDGGLSGATMERRALQRLLDDIRAGKVDVVVVYKVDRLTRSLTDFAEIVETFDNHNVSFVSVTQQFNTTTSMGRLTLNVLLSFAQFEREVTGERIRDKIAASKQKGMWMGGTVPLGYDSEDRKLVVNEVEAEVVRHVFRRYAALGSVRELKDELEADGVVSKVRVHKSGRRVGGVPFSRGALYHMLRNRIYLGEIVHKGENYPGEHDAIVDRDLWDRVQKTPAANRIERRSGANAKEPSLLGGLLFDADGRRLTPTHANKGTRRYRYYVSEALSLPAREVETAAITTIIRFLENSGRLIDALSVPDDDIRFRRRLGNLGTIAALQLRDGNPSFSMTAIQVFVTRTEVGNDTLSLTCSRSALRQWLIERNLRATNPAGRSTDDILELTIPLTLKRRGVEAKLILDNGNQIQQANPDTALINAVAKANTWNQRLISGKARSIRSLAREIGVTKRYICKLLPLAFLAPDIVKAILEGHQPQDISLESVISTSLPKVWESQRAALGFK